MMATSTPSKDCKIKPGTICLTCSEARRIDEQINEARLLLRRLEAKKKSINTDLNRQHDPFIHRLPAEIASYIFHLCCPSGILTVFGRKMNDKQVQQERAYRKSLISPLVLGAICRYWRTLAFSTPNLWNTIEITMQILQSNHCLPLARGWLDRSAALPLHIQVNLSVQDEEELSDFPIRDVIQLLNEYSSRWLTLDIIIPSNLLDTFRCPKDTILDNIHIAAHLLDDTEATPFDLGTLPSPSVLGIFEITREITKFDYSKLVEFSCWKLSVKELSQIANVAQRLETLLVFHNIVEDSQDSRPTFSSSAFLHLRKFHVPTHPPAVWELLKMPSLKDLQVDDSEQVHPNVCWPKIQDFLRRSQCQVTKLRVQGSVDKYPSIFELLGSLPELETLRVEGVHLPEPFFQHMHNTACLDAPLVSHGADKDLFLPRLRSFTYSQIRNLTWSWVPLLIPAAADSGRNYRPLEELSFTVAWMARAVANRLDGDTLKSIQGARLRGVAIEISSIRDGDIVARSVQGDDD